MVPDPYTLLIIYVARSVHICRGEEGKVKRIFEGPHVGSAVRAVMARTCKGRGVRNVASCEKHAVVPGIARGEVQNKHATFEFGASSVTIAIVGPACFAAFDDPDHAAVLLHHKLAILHTTNASDLFAVNTTRTGDMSTLGCVSLHLPLPVLVEVNIVLWRIIRLLAECLPVLRA